MTSTRRNRLDAPERAGRFSRTRAEHARYEWARRHRPFLLAVFAAFATAGIGVLLVPLPGYDILAGAVFASGAWAVAGIVLVMSGSASLEMGTIAAEWTASDLRRLGRRGWKVAHGVRLRPVRDIDHVAIGPGGLLVVETKWGGQGWAGRFADDRTAEAVEQVLDNARDLGAMFPHVRPLIPLVVLWGHPGPRDPVRVSQGVTIIDGAELADWLTHRTPSSEETAVDPVVTARAWAVLSGHVERRQLHDDASQPEHTNLNRIVTQVSYGLIAGIVIMTAFAFMSSVWTFPLSGATALLVWRLRHRSRHSLALATAAMTVGLPTAGVLLVACVLSVG